MSLTYFFFNLGIYVATISIGRVVKITFDDYSWVLHNKLIFGHMQI